MHDALKSAFGVFRALADRARPPQNRERPWAYRLPPLPVTAPPAGPFSRSTRLALAEATLMAADEPLNARKLAQAAGLSDAAEARRLVLELQGLYDAEGSAFQVEEVAGGFQLLTRKEYYPWLARFRRAGGDLKLTPASRETLAIIAYRQPIMRADVEAVRGVQCSDVLRLLMEKNLVRIVGRDNSLGRPVVYGTTRKFLQLYGFRGLRDLPRAEEFKRPDGEKKKPELVSETLTGDTASG